MGSWGTAPWDNDTAADWFGDFFADIDLNAKIKAAFTFDDDIDDHADVVRAACFILGSLGREYVWKGDLSELKQLLEQGITVLSQLIDTENGQSDFLALWENNPEVITSVQAQIQELRARRSELM